MRKLAQNHHFYIFLAVLLVLTSCVKEMDFDGVKDITLEPQIEIKLLKGEFTQDFMVQEFEKYLPSGVPLQGYIPASINFSLPEPHERPISLTSEERILEYLVDGTNDESGEPTPVLKFEFTNTIDSSFDFDIKLLDKDGDPIEEDGVEGDSEVQASSGGVIEKSNISYFYSAEKIKNATDVFISFTMSTVSDLHKGTDNSLTIDASGVFNFNYDISNGLP
ncbi:hypothetical protein I215_12293 [Galbibacter marinus]|uniref:Lipoprotein n=1 Tax=Galbibacter marinus TaxID=555500 RepID=K2PPP0_9FLAO|nr:hypothetical protein [Galbibacter marinus]EKF54515.1 hypothetical protein I215_12293 [Galbibacter marinus]